MALVERRVLLETKWVVYQLPGIQLTAGALYIISFSALHKSPSMPCMRPKPWANKRTRNDHKNCSKCTHTVYSFIAYPVLILRHVVACFSIDMRRLWQSKPLRLLSGPCKWKIGTYCNNNRICSLPFLCTNEMLMRALGSRVNRIHIFN